MREKIEELARECGLLGYEFVNGKPVLEKISRREIRFFNEALELAARECDTDAEFLGNVPDSELHPLHVRERELHRDRAAAIRKLKVG